MVFVGVTTLTAGWMNVTGMSLPQISQPGTKAQGIVNLVLTVIIMASVVLIVAQAVPKWIRVIRGKPVYLEPDVGMVPVAIDRPK
jgi:hypothetical protein